MADYGDILSKSLRFAVQPKRWLQLLIIDAVFYSVAAWLVLSNIQNFISFFASAGMDLAVIGPVVSFISYMVAASVVFWLARMWIQGALLQQSANEKTKVADSYRYGLRRFISLLLATAIAAIIGGLAGAVPFVGTVLTFMVSIVLVFASQCVMVSKLGFAEALGNACKMFRERPGSVFLAWLATSLVSLVIMVLFLLPAFIAFGSVLFPALMGITGSDVSSFMPLITTITQNLGLLGIAAFIFLVGSSIAGAFSIKALTEFYKAWSKKKLF